MLEITARILQRSVFIPDEPIDCEIVITNHGPDEKKLLSNSVHTHTRHVSDTRLIAPDVWSKGVEMNRKHSAPNDVVTLAWGSAQIYCQCDYNERRLRIPSKSHSKHDHSIQSTSFSPIAGEKGHCLFSTNASILFCDLKLKKGETKKFFFSESLPCDIPPSYKGQHIKFSYKVGIGIGRIDRPLCMLKLPFRLFILKGIFKAISQKSIDKSFEREESPITETGCSSTPVSDQSFTPPPNPFLQDDIKNSFSTLDAAMDALTAYTVKRNLNTYNIQSTSGAVGKFCLSKHYYRLGEDILGSFDFSESVIKCVKYAVSLQIEETISKYCLMKPAADNFLNYITLSRYEECCYLSNKTNFLLPIPVTSTPEFTHKIVSVRWRLHFEFTIENNDTTSASTSQEECTDEEKDLNKCVPRNIKTEFMLWDLPVHVVATNPILASLMMQAESVESVKLPHL